MTTVAQAFESLSQSLNLTESEQEKVSRQQNVLRENLVDYFGATTGTFLTGSYARHTAIRPLHDVDLFLCLDRQRHGRLYSGGPSVCLGEVKGALRRAYPNTDFPSKQNRSVNITFQSGVGYDIVPAFAHPRWEGVYEIPDRVRNARILSNPKAHAEHSTQANQRAGNKLKPIIKMVKHWNVKRGKPLPSFHLEMMACGAFRGAPGSYAEGVRDLFAHLAAAVLVRCPDPAGVGANIDEGMPPEERQAIARQLHEAHARATTAITHESWNVEAAHQAWRSLFGEVYRG